MSQWTHVNCSIRVDSFRFLPQEEKPKIVGDLPEGSEGPLSSLIWVNPDVHHMAAYTVVVFGDLRDYDDVQEILSFFSEFTKDRIIRSGILEIDVEFKAVYTYRYINSELKNGEWILINEEEY